MMSKEAMKLALEHAKRDERHINHAETRYWCRMYRDIAEKAIEALAEQPAQRKPLTDEMVVAAARMLSDRQAAECNVDCGDMWKMHGNDFIEDARAALEAAHGITGETQ